MIPPDALTIWLLLFWYLPALLANPAVWMSGPR